MKRTVLVVAALVASIWVYAFNAAPLFYFDTAGYLQQGAGILEVIGIAPAPSDHITALGLGQPDDTVEGSETALDGTVAGARSAVYAVILAGLARVGSIDLGVMLNLAAIWLATWLCARHLCGSGPVMASSIAMLVASVGSLPFYVAFLMPDIFAPVLILSVALLAAYVDKMHLGEIVAVCFLAFAAVILHPSHLAVALLLVPFAAFASRRFTTRGLALALVGSLVILGVSERLLFGYAVERFRQADVMYLPFLTARLIDDGPGYAYLIERCPDPNFPTCLLYERLNASEDPRRLDAPAILFLRDPSIGSFANLSEREQLAVSNNQLEFVAEVVRDAPLRVIGALASNLVDQLAAYRVDMTILRPEERDVVFRMGSGATALRNGPMLSVNRGWLELLAVGHAVLYLTALATIVGMMLGSDRIDPRARVFAGVVLAGIVLNALVCGGISEPAARYGARTAFLLPLVAALLIFSMRWRGAVTRL